MANNELASVKRLEITRLTRQIFIIVAVASVALGITIVGIVYLSKSITFNSKVIGAKEETLATYESNLDNIRLLNKSVMELSSDQALESVARERDPGCVDLEGNLIESDDLSITRTCSALRVVPDAMPSRANPTALGASLTKLITYPGITIDASAVGKETVSSTVSIAPRVGSIPATFLVVGQPNNINGLLLQLESSIRPISPSTVNLEWRSGDNLALSAQTNAYFVNQSIAQKLYKNITMEKK